MSAGTSIRVENLFLESDKSVGLPKDKNPQPKKSSSRSLLNILLEKTKKN